MNTIFIEAAVKERWQASPHASPLLLSFDEGDRIIVANFRRDLQ